VVSGRICKADIRKFARINYIWRYMPMALKPLQLAVCSFVLLCAGLSLARAPEGGYKRNAMAQLDAQRALDKAKLEQEQAEAEKNGHSFGHIPAQNAASGNANENSSRREWKQ
jgi:hypothetical protein